MNVYDVTLFKMLYISRCAYACFHTTLYGTKNISLVFRCEKSQELHEYKLLSKKQPMYIGAYDYNWFFFNAAHYFAGKL